MKVAVLENDTYDSYSEAIFLFEDKKQASDWTRKAWANKYKEMKLKSVCEEKIEEVGCWCHDDYAQICYINIDDEEPQLYKKYWKLIAISESSDKEKSYDDLEINQDDEAKEEKDYYVSYSGSNIVRAINADEACELALDKIDIYEINAYPTKNGEICMCGGDNNEE